MSFSRGYVTTVSALLVGIGIMVGLLIGIYAGNRDIVIPTPEMQYPASVTVSTSEQPVQA